MKRPDRENYTGFWSKDFPLKLFFWAIGCWPLWLAFGGIIAPLVIFIPSDLKPSEKLVYSGVFLQITSIFIIIYELNKLRIKWGFDGFGKSINKKLKELVDLFFRKQKYISLKPDPVEARSSASAKVAFSNDQSLEARIRRLEGTQDNIIKDINKATSRLNKRIDDIGNKYTENFRQQEKFTREIQHGTLTIELISLVWLLVGIVLATLPEDILQIYGLLISFLNQ